MTRLLYVINIPRFFVSHRLPLALAARAAGYDVHVTTSDADIQHVAIINDSGLTYHPLPLSQHGTSPLSEARTLFALIRLYSHLKPDIVHQVSIKPVIYGGIAARLTGIPGVVSAMSGLGYVFVGEGMKPAILRQLVKPGFKLALRGRACMIFQNPDDRQRFVEMGLIPPARAVVIKGAGVDVDVFTPQPEPEGKPVVLFAGRLLWKKGVGEFVESARRLPGQARFVIAGYPEETSPDNVSPEQIALWAAAGIIEYWGKRDDMPQVFAQSHLVCLPSTYGEGVPKVLIEAAACGRAIVTTNTPGCREIVRHGENGLLVSPGDVDALTDAIRRLLDDKALRDQMGARGRDIAVSEFALNRIIGETLDLYERVLVSQGRSRAD